MLHACVGEGRSIGVPVHVHSFVPSVIQHSLRLQGHILRKVFQQCAACTAPSIPHLSLQSCGGLPTGILFQITSPWDPPVSGSTRCRSEFGAKLMIVGLQQPGVQIITKSMQLQRMSIHIVNTREICARTRAGTQAISPEYGPWSLAPTQG
jgi:hypothetical protein